MKEYVDLNSRYQSAWLEATTRISQRQNSLYIFLVIALGVSGFSFNSRLSPASDESSLITKALLVAAVPLSGIILGWLNQKHDETIALLRRFMADCEVFGSAHPIHQLSYNANACFRAYADKYRKNHNRAFAWSVGTMCLMALLLLLVDVFAADSPLRSNQTLVPFAAVYGIVYLAGAAGAIGTVIRTPEFDFRPDRAAEVPFPQPTPAVPRAPATPPAPAGPPVPTAPPAMDARAPTGAA